MTSKSIFHKIPYIFTFLFLCLLQVRGAIEFSIDQLTTANGLSNNTIRHIMQDSQGRMWFATSNGICMYDKGEFTVLRPSHYKSQLSLVDQRVDYMYEDSNCRMWIHTANGISCYDLHDECFIDYKDKGITCPNAKKTPERAVKDKKGQTWNVTDQDGLYVTDKEGRTTHYTTDSPTSSLYTNSLKCIFIDKDDNIWIGTENLGISRLNVMQSDGVDYLLNGQYIRMLTRLGKDRIAVANRSGDLWIYDDQLTTLISHTTNEHNTYCILEDSHHNIWRGTKGGGLYLNDTRVAEVDCDAIFSLYEDSDSTVWIGTLGEGLYTYSYANAHAVKAGLTATEGSKRVRGMVRDKKGHVWTATSDGIYVLKQSNGIKVLAHHNMESGRLSSNEVRAIFKDSKGRIYFSQAGEGFAISVNKLFGHYDKRDSLVNDMVQCFVEDKEGFMWIPTELGISCFNPATRSFTNYYFSHNMLNNVYSENCGVLLSDGRLAFGTNNGIVIVQPWVYNGNKKVREINIEDITLNGRPLKPDVRYIISRWYRSVWFYISLAILVLIAIIVAALIRRRKHRYDRTIHDLSESKDELEAEKDELVAAKDVLEAEKDVLEEQQAALMAEKEKLEKDVHIRRKEEQTDQDKYFVSKVEKIAEEQLTNPDFTVDDFALMMGLGRTIFFRRMRETTGYSPKEYLILKRIRRAAYLIATTSHTISEVSTLVGINDPLYLSRIFKSEYNCSPTEWRKKHNHNEDSQE